MPMGHRQWITLPVRLAFLTNLPMRTPINQNGQQRILKLVGIWWSSLLWTAMYIYLFRTGLHALWGTISQPCFYLWHVQHILPLPNRLILWWVYVEDCWIRCLDHYANSICSCMAMYNTNLVANHVRLCRVQCYMLARQYYHGTVAFWFEMINKIVSLIIY